MSDDSDQDAATTFAHMKFLYKLLIEENKLERFVSTMWEDTDGCASQYRCAVAIYLTTVLSASLNITIDRAIGAPGHGKDVVDGLNARDKCYLREQLQRIVKDLYNPELQVAPVHDATPDGEINFAEQMKSILADSKYFAGQTGSNKMKLRESQAKFKERYYHIQHKKDVEHKQLSMGWNDKLFPKLAIADGKSMHRGSRGVLTHYHFRADPKLGQGFVAVHRIPCACVACTAQLDKEWLPGIAAKEQPRYASVKLCKYWPVLGKYNDWVIMSFKDKGTTEEEFESVHRFVLNGMVSSTASILHDGNFGAINTDDPKTDGYYIVQFKSDPYTLQDTIDVDGQILEKGEVVCDARYFSPAMENSKWYVTPQTW